MPQLNLAWILIIIAFFCIILSGCEDNQIYVDKNGCQYDRYMDGTTRPVRDHVTGEHICIPELRKLP